jgi:hypothetical protein
MRGALLLAAVLVTGCHHVTRPGVTSLTSVPISEGDGGAAAVSTPSIPSTPSTSATTGARAPLVTPGLDNTVSGGVANTGAPLDYSR